MNYKKTLVSAAAAAVLAASFTACGSSGDTTNTTNSVNRVQATGTVTGLVQDTNGNPIEGVKVYIADKEALTNAGGLYTFANVPVSTTSGADAANASQLISVTIAAPTGYIGATVTVTPSAQIDDAEADNVAGATTNVTGGSETFIDGYLAQAGTAVLPALSSTVTGTLRNTNTGAAIAGAVVNLDFTDGGSTAAIAQEQAQDGVVTTYAVSNYSVTTAADGTYTFENIPSDSTYTTSVEAHNAVAGACAGFATDAEDQLSLGNCTTTPVVANDTIAPNVANSTALSPTVSSLANVGTSITTRTLLIGSTLLMLEDDVRDSVTINFTEAIASLSENDTDFTKSVTVYDWTNGGYMDLSAADAVTISGNTVTINFPTPLIDAQEFDVNLLVTDFKDEAGNKLAIIDGLAVLPALAGDNVDNTATSVINATQSVRVQLIAYNDLNTDAGTVTAATQMSVDSSDDSSATNVDETDVQAYSNAFNDVLDDSGAAPRGAIDQLNVLEAAVRLSNLEDVQNDGLLNANGVLMSTTATRVSFTPSGATNYMVAVTTAAGAAKNQTAAILATQYGTSTNVTIGADFTGANNFATFAVTDANTVELYLDTVNATDVVIITPFDDFGYAGTPATVTLVDNTAATTIIQSSYLLAEATTNAGGAITAIGNGGELGNDYAVSAAVGTPILGLTPGLLDNLDANGNNILDDNGFVNADQSLEQELFVNNGKNVATPPARVINIANVYDNTAFKLLDTARQIGVAFSEDIDLTGVTPTYTGTTVSNYVANNNVAVNDNGVGTTADLVNFETTDVMALANDNHGKVMSFDGILDAAANVASNADVVTEDMMPPFVTKAEYTGADLTITFNEAITSPTTGIGAVTINVRNAGNTNDRDIVLDTALINTATNTTWGLDATNKVLTISANYLALTANSNLLAPTLQVLFDAGSYIETDYDTTAKQHARLEFWNIQDRSANANSWANWDLTKTAGEVPAVEFAAVDMIGTFVVTADASNFNIGDDVDVVRQEIVWTFSHAIAADTLSATASEFFDTDTAGVSVNATTGVITATNVAIAAAGAWDGVGTNDYSETIATIVVAPGAYSALGASFDNVGSFLTLSADRTVVTFSFIGTGLGTNLVPNDQITFTGTAGLASLTAFKSVYTADQIINLTANTQ